MPAEAEQVLTDDIIELASRFGRYGYRRITALLRHRGWSVNHKRVERIWRREGLKVPIYPHSLKCADYLQIFGEALGKRISYLRWIAGQDTQATGPPFPVSQVGQRELDFPRNASKEC